MRASQQAARANLPSKEGAVDEPQIFASDARIFVVYLKLLHWFELAGSAMAKPRPHIPTAKTLSQVRMGAMLGVPPHDIAKLLGITKGQLLKHYADGLATCHDRADKAVRAESITKPTEFGHAKSALWRLAKEREEPISRSARLDACETAALMIERAMMAKPMWTEEAVEIYRRGGDSAFRQWLRTKAVETCNSLADLMQHPTTLDDPGIPGKKAEHDRREHDNRKQVPGRGRDARSHEP